MSAYTDSLGLEEITPGDQAGLWGNTTNNNLALIDQAVTGVTPISFLGLSGSVKTLESANGALDEARAAVLNITGLATGTNTVVVPNKQKTYLVRNDTGRDVIFRTATPGATFTVEAGNSILVFCDGDNGVFTGIASASVGPTTVPGGGTGVSTFAAGFVISPGAASNLTTQPAIGIGGTVSGSPVTNQTTGQLQVANGGTGSTTLTSGGLLRGNGTSAVDVLVGGANGQVATWNGSQWTAATPTTGGVNSVSSGGNISVTPTTGSVVVSLSGANVISALGYTPGNVLANSNNTYTSSVNTYATTSSITMNGSFIGDQRLIITGAGLGSGMSPSGVQCGISGAGVIYQPAGGFDGGNAIGVIGLSNSIQISSSGNFFTGSPTCFKIGSSTAWTILSDARIKTNVTPYTKGLAELNQVQIKNYEFNGLGGTKAGTKGLGVIADEIEKVLPETVTTYKTKLNPTDAEPVDLKNFNSTELVYLLVNSVKELKAELDIAKAEIAALKVK